MELKEAIRVCEENDKLVIDINEAKIMNHLSFETVLKIAANINNVTVEEMKGGRGNDALVNSRWLFLHYFYSASSYSYMAISVQLNRDHSTLIHSVKENSNQRLDGWRLKNKEKFANRINLIHDELEISKFEFKDFGKR